MRTTLDIAAHLLEAVLKTTAEESKSKAVTKALREYIRVKRMDELKAMAGTSA